MILVGSLLVAGVILLWRRFKAREYVEKEVEWWTLMFFLFLFAVAGALEFTGVTDRLADAMVELTGGNILGAITLMLWIATWGSAFLDNVVLVAAFIPVVHALGSSGITAFPLWWALLFGGTFGGNITLIGSTANIVALGLLEKHRKISVSFFEWFKIGVIGGIVPILIGLVMILVQLPLMPR
jgi:Na+/H+ antiporter NhaD/arsenite permease-like protein